MAPSRQGKGCRNRLDKDNHVTNRKVNGVHVGVLKCGTDGGSSTGHRAGVRVKNERRRRRRYCHRQHNATVDEGDSGRAPTSNGGRKASRLVCLRTRRGIPSMRQRRGRSRRFTELSAGQPVASTAQDVQRGTRTRSWGGAPWGGGRRV